jgi:hypothetical protein
VPLVLTLLSGCGKPQERGVISGAALPAEIVEQREAEQAAAAANTPDGKSPADSRILFGDLHVHTTFSPDAFIMSVPIMGGSGLRSPADACDFARYCSALDFWSINDHAEGITPRLWKETRKSIRECNARSGDPENPDLVAFLGWEWSQVNTQRALHFGHKNVIFRETSDDRVPSRAIASPREQLARAPMGRAAQLMMALADFENRDFYFGIQGYYDEIGNTPICEQGVDSRVLPNNCLEIADDPRALFTKLDQWGFDSIVIPHGTSWGMNTPPLTTLDKQLNRQQHDPERQVLFEVFSGHGNSEEYRDWRAVEQREDGSLGCPAPSDNYLPCCWRAGDIIRERCTAAGIDDTDCETRAETARQNFVDAGISGHLTVPGQQVTDWLNCGNCPDCFLEPMDHRPASSAQYALAITGLEQPGDPLNFRFGFIGSTDNHRAMAGSGYKQVQRKRTTEAFGASSDRFQQLARGDELEPLPHSIPLDTEGVGLVNLRNMERQNSFWLSGGLAAVHSNGRGRDAIWEGFRRREVYGTTGDHILLWFDLLRDGVGIPMGSETTSATTPHFRVSAVGEFKQLPGCPDHAVKALGREQLERLCGGECYNPSGERHRIDRIEVIRIRPRVSPGEDVGALIEDPWKTLDCPGDPQGCVIEFEDEDFVSGGRETVYYVRAIQEATPMINADNVRCEYSEQGECIAVNPCYGDYRTAEDDDCLAPAEQRAWSSPIFVNYQPAPAPIPEETIQ